MERFDLLKFSSFKLNQSLRVSASEDKGFLGWVFLSLYSDQQLTDTDKPKINKGLHREDNGCLVQ